MDAVNILRREPDWKISLVSSAEEAITSVYARPFDVIIIGKDVNAADEQKLRAVLNHCSFKNVILKQKSDDPEMLKEEILRYCCSCITVATFIVLIQPLLSSRKLSAQLLFPDTYRRDYVLL